MDLFTVIALSFGAGVLVGATAGEITFRGARSGVYTLQSYIGFIVISIWGLLNLYTLLSVQYTVPLEVHFLVGVIVSFYFGENLGEGVVSILKKGKDDKK